MLNAGEAEHRGRSYERVFVTWGAAEPHLEDDQYLLWIDKETGLVEMVRYTVRELLLMTEGLTHSLTRALGAGTIHFDDYREIDGVMIPFVQTVNLAEPLLTQYPVSGTFLHRLEIEDARFDTIPPETLTPDPSRPRPADSKPMAAG